MPAQRSNEDQAVRISKSIFVTNFPDNLGSKELWKVCEGYGKVIDVFIPNRRSKAGKRFAFVRFIRVNDLDRLVGNLCTIWIGRFHLHANVARFERANKPVKPSGPSQSNAHGTFGSFVSAARDFPPLIASVAPVSSSPALVLDDSCVVERDLSCHVMGRALNSFWSMYAFLMPIMILFVLNDVVGRTLRLSQFCWSRETFAKIGNKWGEALDIEDNFGSSFARKRLYILTKQPESILEKFKVIFKGKVFVARAKELFTWNPSFQELGVFFTSDDRIMHGLEFYDGGRFVMSSQKRNVKVDGVSETVFSDTVENLDRVLSLLVQPSASKMMLFRFDSCYGRRMIRFGGIISWIFFKRLGLGRIGVGGSVVLLLPPWLPYWLMVAPKSVFPFCWGLENQGDPWPLTLFHSYYEVVNISFLRVVDDGLFKAGVMVGEVMVSYVRRGLAGGLLFSLAKVSYGMDGGYSHVMCGCCCSCSDIRIEGGKRRGWGMEEQGRGREMENKERKEEDRIRGVECGGSITLQGKALARAARIGSKRSHYSESKTQTVRTEPRKKAWAQDTSTKPVNGRKRLSEALKQNRSPSPRLRPRKEGGVFNRLGRKEPGAYTRSDSHHQSSQAKGIEVQARKHHHEGTSSRRTNGYSESEDSEGGHWESKICAIGKIPHGLIVHVHTKDRSLPSLGKSEEKTLLSWSGIDILTS
ncbi:RNA-directed DNA polymerase, eukaryota [Tanacetum coccineum]